MSERSAKRIIIVDDDPSIREALSLLLSLEGYQTSDFADGASGMEAIVQLSADCIILDVKLPDKSGLHILRELKASACTSPVIILSGYGDIPMAVEAMSSGAFDFIEKPFRVEFLLATVRAAVAGHHTRRPHQVIDDIELPHFFGQGRLTPRERVVLSRIAGGASNKEVGRQLGISPRTVEVHRAHIMNKLNAKNTAHLMRIVLAEKRRA